jgi:hypothetical protein
MSPVRIPPVSKIVIEEFCVPIKNESTVLMVKSNHATFSEVLFSL